MYNVEKVIDEWTNPFCFNLSLDSSQSHRRREGSRIQQLSNGSHISQSNSRGQLRQSRLVSTLTKTDRQFTHALDFSSQSPTHTISLSDGVKDGVFLLVAASSLIVIPAIIVAREMSRNTRFKGLDYVLTTTRKGLCTTNPSLQKCLDLQLDGNTDNRFRPSPDETEKCLLY